MVLFISSVLIGSFQVRSLSTEDFVIFEGCFLNRDKVKIQYGISYLFVR